VRFQAIPLENIANLPVEFFSIFLRKLTGNTSAISSHFVQIFPGIIAEVFLGISPGFHWKYCSKLLRILSGIYWK